MFYLGVILQLAALVSFILVLVKLFQTKGALHGILGLFCGIYTFIWGWMNAKSLNLMKLMLIWTLGGAIGYALMIPQMVAQTAEMQKAMQEAAQKSMENAAPAPQQ